MGRKHHMSEGQMEEHAVTCWTPKCVNRGIEMTIAVDDSDPDIPPPRFIFCGPCGAVIADLTNI